MMIKTSNWQASSPSERSMMTPRMLIKNRRRSHHNFKTEDGRRVIVLIGNFYHHQSCCFLLLLSLLLLATLSSLAGAAALNSRSPFGISPRTMLAMLATPSEGPLSLPPPARLRRLLEQVHATTTTTTADGAGSGMPLLMPCCYDGLTARLVARAGFNATFMTGFGVSAAMGFPDTQLVSYAEMLQAAQHVCEGLSSAATEMGRRTQPIPCIAVRSNV
jgi:hypothetical protein